MKLYFKHIITSIFLIFLFQHYGLASQIDKSNAIRTASPNGIPVSVGTPMAIDSVFITGPQINQVDYSITNRISLGVDLHYPEFVGGPQHVKVSVNVSKYDASHVFIESVNVNLHIDYFHNDTLHSFVLDRFEFQGSYKLVFRIDTVWINGVNNDTLPKNLFVKGSILGERYTQLNTATGSGNCNIQYLDLDNDAQSDEIQMSWPVIDGAEQYQVEFFHVSNYGEGNTIILPNNLKYDYKHNSTRITTSAHSYRIALIFDRGWVAFRIRPVGVNVMDPSKLVYGDWSETNYTGTIAQLNLHCKIEITNAQIHENKLNWQYGVTYAEQGKRKEVVTYFDGTLRSRQEVTKINSNKKAVVGQTIYDYVGRKAISVLPSPIEKPESDTTESFIKFYSSFNQNVNGIPYSKEDITFVSSDSTCSLAAGKMSNISGASLYYSPDNPDKELYQAYVLMQMVIPFNKSNIHQIILEELRKKEVLERNFKLVRDMKQDISMVSQIK